MKNKIKYSTNPYNGEKYRIPKLLDDSSEIHSFLNNNPKRKVVLVQGLGFVGSVMSLVCANSQNKYNVIGIDLPNEKNYWKIQSLKNGHFPLETSDSKVYKYFRNTIKRKNFLATYDINAYSYANFIIVDINLLSN